MINERIEFLDNYEFNIFYFLVINCLVSQLVIIYSFLIEDSGECCLFKYGIVDDKYGMIFLNEECNVLEYESGIDMYVYWKLMEYLFKYWK